MHANDILYVKDGQSEKTFEIVASEQVFRMKANSKAEAEIWKQTILAIVDAVKNSSRDKKSENRRSGFTTPKWKKVFWRVEDRLEAMDGKKSNAISDTASGLFKATLDKPRLMKKLLMQCNSDVKLLKVLIDVMLLREKDQIPVEQAGIKNPVSFDTPTPRTPKSPLNKVKSESSQENTVWRDSSTLMESFMANSSRGHRKSHSSSHHDLNLLPEQLYHPEKKNGHRSRSGSIMLLTFKSNTRAMPTPAKADATKNIKDLWYVESADEKELTESKDLHETIFEEKNYKKFKTYLQSLMRDEYLVFFREASYFQMGKNERGKTFVDQVAALYTGESILKKYLEMEDPSEEELKQCQHVLKSEDPLKAFVPWIKETHSILEELFKEYKGGDFYKRISRAMGPFSEEVILDMIESKKIRGSTFLWQERTLPTSWKKASEFPKFQLVMESSQIQTGVSFTKAEIDSLYGWVTQKDSLKFIEEGIMSQTLTIRVLSFRLLWLVLRATANYDDAEHKAMGKAFTEVLQNSKTEESNSKGINFVMNDHHCMMSMMFNPCKKFNTDFESTQALAPGRVLYNPGLWLPVLTNLYSSQVFPRVKCLEDLYYRIMTNKDASLSIVQNPNWQLWFMPLAMDVASTKNIDSSQLIRYTVGTLGHLLWTSVNLRQFPDFARDLRNTIVIILSMCSDFSKILIEKLLSSVAFRFASEIPKWAGDDQNQQVEKYKCLQHFLRLMISMALCVNAKHFGTSDSMKTQRILPKEVQERNEFKQRERKSVANHIRVQTMFPDFSNHFTPSDVEGYLQSRPYHPDTPLPVPNDQQIIYILKVYNFTQEETVQATASQVLTRKLLSSAYLKGNNNREIIDPKDNEQSSDEQNVKRKAERSKNSQPPIVYSSKHICDVLKRRNAEMTKSLLNFDDTNHICEDENFLEDIQLVPHGVGWHSVIQMYMAPLKMIQRCLAELKLQNDKIRSMSPLAIRVRSDTRCKRMRRDLANQTCFVNDTLTFLHFMRTKLWKMLSSEQCSKLVMQFITGSDSSKRRKVFHGWEKEKLKNDAKKLEKLEEIMAKRLRGKRAFKFLIGKKATKGGVAIVKGDIRQKTSQSPHESERKIHCVEQSR